MWTGGPREVVHIGSPIPVVPIGAVAGRDLTLGATRRRLRRQRRAAAGGAHDELARDGDAHVVDAVIGVELGGGN